MFTELGLEIDDQPQEKPETHQHGRTCSGAELAEWLRMTPMGVSKLKKSGRLRTAEGGEILLKESVQAYIDLLRSRQESKGTTSRDYDVEYKKWKTEDVKQRVLSWRLSYGRDLVRIILGQLRETATGIQAALAAHPDAQEAMRNLLQAIQTADTEGAVLEASAAEEDEFREEDDE